MGGILCVLRWGKPQTKECCQTANLEIYGIRNNCEHNRSAEDNKQLHATFISRSKISDYPETFYGSIKCEPDFLLAF
jgi:hypothetical protein